MQMNNNEMAPSRWRLLLRSDVNGLLVVIGVLVALMLLPGPTEAEFQARDVQMNDMVTVDDLKR
ncbi:MAG: hypothetical protein ACR2PI_25650 [Hyphomicrobiaceae bacterium]